MKATKDSGEQSQASAYSQGFRSRLTRQTVLSLASCVHCGLCADSCHYYLVTHDPEMTPARKADQVRKLYKAEVDWLGRLLPAWVGGGAMSDDQQLEDLKDVVFGSCTMCRRCTFSCPFGVDTGLIMRYARGLLTARGIAPAGVLAVNKDQWETGNQMGVSQQDYLETLEWLQDELRGETGDPEAAIPIDKQGANIVFVVNPREIKYAPLSLLAAAKIFHAAGEDWTMPSVGWDNTSFGLFSGDDELGAYIGKLAYDQAIKLGVKKMVVSECGHGLRATKWEAPNWAGMDLPFAIESFLETMVDYVNTGRIVLDPARNPKPVTYHDPCNIARSGGITEEPRYLLQRACTDYREMTPNRQENYCCTGGGGALSMAEYKPRRLEVARIKADQLRATGAASVATACHNCIDGLTDVIKHYKLNMPVRNVCEFVADALVLDAAAAAGGQDLPAEARGRTVLVVDDDPEAVATITGLLEAHGLKTRLAATTGEAWLEVRRDPPDLIVLDVALEERAGVGLFTGLRSKQDYASIPIVVVTGGLTFRELTAYRSAPAPEMFLDKPVKPALLLNVVRTALEMRARAAARAGATAN